MHEPFNAADWLVARHVREGRGGRLAVRCEGRSVTYQELLQEIKLVAGGLRGLGVRPEERVAMVMLDSVEFIATFLGAMWIGAIPVLTNPLLPGRDISVIVADSRAKVLVISSERIESLPAIIDGAPEVTETIETDHWEDFTSQTNDCEMYATWGESPGFWLCTSGTTGQPKLAMHRHSDLKATSDTFGINVLGITQDDRCYSVGPMFHAYGLGNSMTFPFAVGASVVLVPTRPPTPALVAKVVVEEQPTLFFCIPTFYAALVNADLPADTFSSVRWALSAAESLPAETFTKFGERFGVTILDGIGSTEILHVYLSNAPGRIKAGTSGIAVPGYEVRVVDEHGDLCPPGVPGKLQVRGESTATGYWCRSETTRATFVGEWILTGDLYVEDDEGFYKYLGRGDDMLRIGGEWVSPAEVEGVLISHPGVLEAAVIGAPDSNATLRPVAFVIPLASKPGAAPLTVADLDEFCRELLAGYKRPKSIKLVDELPKTATGKIQRFRLRALAE